MKQERPEPSDQEPGGALPHPVRIQAPTSSQGWRHLPQSVRGAATAASLEDFMNRAVKALSERGRK